MGPRYPRHRSVPAPTIAPPDAPVPHDDEPVAKQLAARLESWKVLVALGLSLIGLGVYFANWQHGVATKDGVARDIEREQAARAAAVQPLAGSVYNLAIAQARAEASADARARLLDDVLGKLDGRMERLDAQIDEIAKTTGARRVPAADLDTKGTPP